MKYVTTINEREYIVEILEEHRITVDGVTYDIDFQQVGEQPVYSLLVNGQSYDARVYAEDDLWRVLFHSRLFVANVEDEREKRLRASLGSAAGDQGEFHLKAPMPGLIVAIPVEAGQTVQKGEVLVILESMKMQNELKAPRAGVVSRLKIAPGSRVEKKETLLTLV